MSCFEYPHLHPTPPFATSSPLLQSSTSNLPSTSNLATVAAHCCRRCNLQRATSLSLLPHQSSSNNLPSTSNYTGLCRCNLHSLSLAINLINEQPSQYQPPVISCIKGIEQLVGCLELFVISNYLIRLPSPRFPWGLGIIYHLLLVG
uniref:Uncharacterized protein LOC113785682 n=1 Tax=Cicer arietinum TaxID=3827 RepID=A0A3Q7X300_CICAR|nr:uncharacterized protein LOC113785682 [Cicer arietinum]